MKKILIIAATVILMASSCKKDSIVFVPDPGQQLDSGWVTSISDKQKITELVKSIIPPPPATEEAEIIKDTTYIRRELFDIIIPPGSLKGTATADVIGKISFQFSLLQKKGDYIRLQQSTINGERFLLNSGGGFFIRFFRGTEEINIVPGKNILVKYNDPLPLQNMKVFYGTDNIANPVPVNTGGTWTVSTNNNYVKPIQRKFNTTSYYGYEVSTDKLRWINTALNLPSGITLVNLSVYVPDLFSNANTQAFIVFKDLRTVVQLSGDAGSRKFTAANIPAGKAALIVTISKVAGDYFLGTREIITSDKPVEVKPLPGGLDRITSYLNSL